MPEDLDTGKLIQSHPFLDRPRSKTGSFVRTFKNDLDTIDLTWHKDLETRLIIPIEGVNWRLQFDNEIPLELIVGSVYVVEREIYHRLIKGHGDLVIFVKLIET